MKQHLKGLSAFCLLVVFLTTTIVTAPVRAATFGIDSITPATVINNINNNISIKGHGFPNQAKVDIGSEHALVTSFSAAELIVRVPAGFEPGDYSVTVTSPTDPLDLDMVSNALHVLAPTPTAPPAAFERPRLRIDTYSISVKKVRYGEDFDLNVSLDNAGGSTAHGLQVTFVSTDLLMISDGGVITAGDLGVAGKANFGGKMTAAAPLTEKIWVSMDMSVSYVDDKGTAFTEKFTLVFPAIPTPSGNATPPTPTPGPLQRSQLVITDYGTDLDPLQPGTEFTLSLSVKNTGNLNAKNVTMIVGGGTSSGGGSGTPQPGGINGGSGEFSNFAPVGTSNLQSLGDLAPGSTKAGKQRLIVNVSANPGAYPVKITFSYTDGNGNQVNDDQVITLLIYSLPNIDVAFYQPVSDLLVGQPGPLPLQVTSLGKRQAVLGKMRVQTDGGMVTNGEALVGSLDPGGYFTLDAMVMPNVPGPLNLTITIEYLDDFNQPQTINKTITLNVIDAPVMPPTDPNNPGGYTDKPVTQQTTGQKIWRFILGLLGLDSSAPSTPPNIGPNNGIPTEVPIYPVPVKPGGGKG